MAILPLASTSSLDRRNTRRMTKSILAFLVFVVAYSSLSLWTDDVSQESFVSSASRVLTEEQSEPPQNDEDEEDAEEPTEGPQNFPVEGVVEGHKRAIVMISFGESAAENPLLERAILSIRRRGEFDGPIVVITDAAVERYEGIFDENVYVVNAREEDFNYDLKSRAMVFKRFKTLILNYIDLIPDLDDVDYVYYMDMDVMLGAPFDDMVQGLQARYGIESNPMTPDSHDAHLQDETEPSSHDEGSNDEEDSNDSNDTKEIIITTSSPKSTLYFFQNFPGSRMNYFGCGGFFIMNRRTSQTCLHHWREEIDKRPYQSFDQRALTVVADSIKEGTIHDCVLHVMEIEHFVSYPISNEELEGMMDDASYTNLIHIFNTGAEQIDDGLTEKFVAEVLMLTPAEKATHRFGKNIITAST